MSSQQNNNLKEVPLIAFAHIEKTGGTSFNGILRSYHGAGYAHVRTLLHPASPGERAVHMDDLAVYQRLVPWLSCISGHAIRPWVLESEGLRRVLYLTILRNPVERYVSYYTYGGGMNRKPWPFSFEEYLRKKEFYNYQTRRIAGQSDATIAWELIENRFLAAVVLEKMDELVEKLNIIWPGITEYASMVGKRNVRVDQKRNAIIDQYHDAIIQNNEADILLYNKIRDKFDGMFLRENLFSTNKAITRRQNIFQKYGRAREITSAIMRRAYITPVTGLIRLAHELPFRGTY